MKLKSLVTFTAFIFAGLAGYQAVCQILDDKSFPPKGELISVSGRKMHIHASGELRGATVILESGLCGIGSDFQLVQDKVADFTRVVSYDRSGLGYSQVSSNKRNCREISLELKELLNKRGISGPYILVGHSFGGVVMQYFASCFPDEIKGLVLVDTCPEEIFDYELVQSFEPLMKKHKQSSRMFVLSFFGFSRLVCQFVYRNSMSYLPKNMKDVHLACLSSTKHCVTTAKEFKNLKKSLKMIKKIDRVSIENIPCHVISSGREFNLGYFGLSNLKKEQIQQANFIWGSLQRCLADKFKGSVHKISEKSDHMVIWHDPDMIAGSIKTLLDSD